MSPASVTIDYTLGDANPAAQTITIKRADTTSAALTGLALGNITYVGPTGWLTATLSGSEAPATLTLNVNKGTLAPGTYSGTIPITSSVATNSPQTATLTFKISQRPPPPTPTGATVTVLAAGNLGCNGDLAKASAAAISAVKADYMFVLGDNAQRADGAPATPEDYMNCFDPVFGLYKPITYAAVGNRDQHGDSSLTPGFSPGADAYFGLERVGEPGKNYYSFDVGSWHIIVLNVVSGGPEVPVPYFRGSDQDVWLAQDLRANRSKKCTLAFWHDPLWMSSNRAETEHDKYPNRGYRAQAIRGTWMRLYPEGADLVINGGEHIYERFAPMRYEGTYDFPDPIEFRLDSAYGIVQITSGLGGSGPVNTPSVAVTHPLSQYRSGGDGFLKLVLGEGDYSWEFINSRYSHISDSGYGKCHDRPPS